MKDWSGVLFTFEEYDGGWFFTSKIGIKYLGYKGNKLIGDSSSRDVLRVSASGSTS